MPASGRLGEIRRQEGLRSLLSAMFWFPHTRLRRYLPRRPKRFNQYLVPAGRMLDRFNPRIPDATPEYEAVLIPTIEQYVKPGDTVVVVGGGWGVSAVAAAEAAGPGGFVYAFEATERYVREIPRTAALNGVGDRLAPVHAVVGSAIDLRGDVDGGTRIHPRYLPNCDILILDAEGAECEILRDMEMTPDRIVVETHGALGCPSDDVATELRQRGYDVEKQGPAHAGEEKDVFVLVGEQ